MRSPEDLLLARLRFRHLQMVAAVDSAGSLSKAAASLNLTQPALSKALKEVEGLLGFALFKRSTRGLQKTTQGAIVMRGATLMLKELRHLHAEAQAAGPAGSLAAVLRLGAPAFLAVSLLPAVVARLARVDPPVAVSLTEANVPRLFERLQDGDLDALVTVYNPEAMARTAGQGVRFEPFAEEAYAVIAPVAHRLARARTVDWSVLVDEPWVLTRKPSMARVFIEDTFNRQGLEPPRPICENDSPVTCARMVAEGVGLSLTPMSTAREVERGGRIRRVRMKTPPPSATLGLVYRTAAEDHPRIRLLRNALAQVAESRS